MDKVIYAFFAIAAATASYFWGHQAGQETAQKQHIQQKTLKMAENISHQIQYQTLIELNKVDELQLLVKSRILADKTQLEVQLADPAIQNKALLKDAIATANQVLMKSNEQP
ncbi:hypothetical protein [Pleionea mediterranea]|uniref:Uncharacterized protein n=1 Tax=Pleionea mediterranea TaxID=523701 RepID=A0A316FWS0_9GAMM|nr:hypothetical protein [Pleionea mediterranea]PWK53028.1 hypothetical protein C8D97_104246 [Pleionea mediterranea]